MPCLSVSKPGLSRFHGVLLEEQVPNIVTKPRTPWQVSVLGSQSIPGTIWFPSSPLYPKVNTQTFPCSSACYTCSLFSAECLSLQSPKTEAVSLFVPLCPAFSLPLVTRFRPSLKHCSPLLQVFPFGLRGRSMTVSSQTQACSISPCSPLRLPLYLLTSLPLP